MGCLSCDFCYTIIMKIGIIGGGAAGMMAAATIVESGSDTEVFIIEKNDKLGRKVLMTGGGRCNVTTGIDDIREIFSKYPRGANFLRRALHVFPPSAMRKWCEEHGVPIVVEDDMRVFPASHKGKDIVGIFEKIFTNHGVHILFSHNVINIKKHENIFSIFFSDGASLDVDRVIIAVGGMTYMDPESSTDGYSLARELGHTITRRVPSLTSFVVKEEWIQRHAGVSFSRVHLSAKSKDGKKHVSEGAFLFTHKGISGPAVFALSSLTAFDPCSENEPIILSVDFTPDVLINDIEQIILDKIHSRDPILFKKIIAKYIPISIVDSLFHRCDIPSDISCAHVKKKHSLAIVQEIKNTKLALVGRGSGSEFVTAGGVDLSEVNPNTMESKICPGLFFGGEVLDIDGFTGGFNLQSAWATGRLAGENILKKI